MKAEFIDQLAFVRRQLTHRRGQMSEISRATGVPYDTLKRIRHDPDSRPAYPTVYRLAVHLAHLREEQFAEE